MNTTQIQVRDKGTSGPATSEGRAKRKKGPINQPTVNQCINHQAINPSTSPCLDAYRYVGKQAVVGGAVVLFTGKSADLLINNITYIYMIRTRYLVYQV